MGASYYNNSSSIDYTTEEEFIIPQLPSQFLLVARIVFVCCGVVSNLIVLFIFAQCRRLHHPRHTCWMAVTAAALFVHLLAVIEMLSAAYPSRPAYTFLLVFKGTPFAFFSLGYTLIAVERHLAVSHYLWYKDNVTNRVVVLSFTIIGLIVLAGLVLALSLERESHYFMPGNGTSSWKLVLLGITVVTASLIGIVLQAITYRRVKKLYRQHPSLRQKERHLFQVKYQQQLPGPVAKNIGIDSTCAIILASSTQYSTTPSEKSRASRLDLEAGFYYFVISIPVLLSNGTTGAFIISNHICSYADAANPCHRWDTVLLYMRTFQLLITACNPLVYFGLSSEFRSACRSRFGTTRHNKT